MKRKTLIIILAAEAGLCILWCVLRGLLPGLTASAMAFPFWQLAAGLRALSLSGTVGNLAALLIWAMLGLLPLLPLMGRRERHWEDALLPVLTLGLLLALRLMANPARLSYEPGPEYAAGAIGITLWSLIAAWAVIRLLRYFRGGEAGRLIRSAELMLAALCAYLVLSVLGAGLARLLDSIGAVKAANTGRAGELGMSYVFLCLYYALESLPLILDIVIAFLGLDLLAELRADGYSEGVSSAADRLSGFCVKALVISVLSCAGMNALQLFFLKSLASVNIMVNIPLFSIALALSALLLTRLLDDRRRLKDDNDLFV